MERAFSEKFLSELLDALPLIVLILDESLRVAAVYGDYENLFGKSREEIVGMDVEELVPYKGLGKIINKSGEEKERNLSYPSTLPAAEARYSRHKARALRLRARCFLRQATNFSSWRT